MPGAYFISYSAQDGKNPARRIWEGLSRYPDIQVWWDKEDLKAISPMDWDDQIEQAIQSCAGLIFLMTPDSVLSSSQCKKEWRRALAYRKPLILVRLSAEVEMLPYSLDGRHFMDFSGSEPDVAALYQQIEWQQTPDGLLQQVLSRISDAERDRHRADNEKKKSRIDEDLEHLLFEKDRLERLIQDPQGLASQIEARVKSGIEIEREPEKEASGALKTSKFINPPPAIAPGYFQDRNVETKLAVDFINDPSIRMLTVVGRGGVGKTALICRLLKQLETGVFPDGLGNTEVSGIIYLSGTGSHRISAGGIFTDLTRLLPESDQEQLNQLYQDENVTTSRKFQQLLEITQDHVAKSTGGSGTSPVVVLLDNFEDLLELESNNLKDEELADVVGIFLEEHHHPVKIIITTRIAPVDLALIEPGRQRRIDLDEGLPSPYAENILRELDADDKLGLNTAPDSLLEEARERTMGFPRALEALFAVLSIDRDSNLQELLDDAERYLPANVVEKLVGEAYARLDSDSQHIMQALAVYNRPVTPTAIDFMLLPYVPGVESSKVLKRLANMYFVRREAGKYYLHPVDVRHAKTMLAEIEKSGPASDGMMTFRELAKRGANYYAQLEKPAATWKRLEDIQSLLDEFDLRCEGEDFEAAAVIATKVGFKYLNRWGHYQLMLSMNQKLRGKLDDRALIADCYGNEGFAYGSMGRAIEAIDCYEKALEISKLKNSQEGIATYLTNLADTYELLGRTLKAVELQSEALWIDQKRKDVLGIGIGLHNIGGRYADFGRVDEALTLVEKSIEVARVFQRFNKRHFKFIEGLRLATFSKILIDAGQYHEAIEVADEALTAAADEESPEVSCQSFFCKGLALLCLGKFEEALATAREAEQFEYPRGAEQAMLLGGVAALSCGDRQTAKDKFNNAIASTDESIERMPESYSSLLCNGLASCGLIACGESEQLGKAQRSLSTAVEINRFPGMIKRVERWLDLIENFDDHGNLQREILFSPPNLQGDVQPDIRSADEILDDLGDLYGEENSYRQKLKTEGENGVTLGDFAFFLQNQARNLKKAKAVYKKALKFDPEDSVNLSNYASHCLISKDFDGAEINLRKAWDTKPADPDGYTIRPLILMAALANIRGGRDTDFYLGQIKNLFDQGNNPSSSQNRSVLDFLKGNIGKTEFDLFHAIYGKINNSPQTKGKLESLDRWKAINPVALSTEWPPRRES